MNTFMAFLKKRHLGKIVMVFLAGVLLLVTTACNAGDELGARPNNPPVQMGGSNNPHKGGGDGYTEYKASTDRAAVKGDKNRASLPTGQWVATINSNASDLLYPGSNATDTRSPGIGPVGKQGQRQLMDPTQIPAPRQPVIDRSNPDAKILEKTGQAFKDASNFLNDTAASATQRPEMQTNPAFGK